MGFPVPENDRQMRTAFIRRRGASRGTVRKLASEGDPFFRPAFGVLRAAGWKMPPGWMAVAGGRAEDNHSWLDAKQTSSVISGSTPVRASGGSQSPPCNSWTSHPTLSWSGVDVHNAKLLPSAWLLRLMGCMGETLGPCLLS